MSQKDYRYARRYTVVVIRAGSNLCQESSYKIILCVKCELAKSVLSFYILVDKVSTEASKFV